MVNIAEVKNVMDRCSMPLELTIEEFKKQALETHEDAFLCILGAQTTKEIIEEVKRHNNYINKMSEMDMNFAIDAALFFRMPLCFHDSDEGVSLNDLKDLVKALLERFDKPSESIDDIYEKDDMCFLIRNGLVFISEEERRQREQGTPQYIDELLGALNDVITNSQQEIKELEEERDKLVEEINQKRNQMLQGIEALRSRLAELGADCENILPQRDERIREME